MKTMTSKNFPFLLVAIGFVLFLHGAVPFVTVPTLAQSLWTSGFGLSLAKTEGLTLYATHFGYPEPAAIAFGLAGALPVSFLISLGLHPADAYTTMIAMWLIIALLGALRMGTMFGISQSNALLAAVLWMCLPVVWYHQAYAMLGLGMALLPAYFLTASFVILNSAANLQKRLLNACIFCVSCMVAVFMDGYTFMMFAVGTGLLIAFTLFRRTDLRRNLLLHTFPVCIVGFGLAYVCYGLYIGKASFGAEPIQLFRAWGVDLKYLVVPTQGIHWLWDMLGLSVARSSQEFFGDASLWSSTFALPLIITGTICWWKTRKSVWLATGLLIIALGGLYMSLGPSLKIDSARPEQMSGKHEMFEGMPAEEAIAPTGNEILSQNIPGFQNMRAAYRWIALSLLGFWWLILLAGSLQKSRVGSFGMGLILLALIIINIPHLGGQWQRTALTRKSFLDIEHDLISDLGMALNPGERVAFLPYRNDFLVNYIAPRLDIRTYNVGGDKNLMAARRHWPMTLSHFPMGKIDDGFTDRVIRVLTQDKVADAVVLPYIDMFWAAQVWPPDIEYRDDLQPVVHNLQEAEQVNVKQSNYYALVRSGVDSPERDSSDLSYPIQIARGVSGLQDILGPGWYDVEKNHVWSGSEAELLLPVPKDCEPGQCAAELDLAVYGASQNRQVEVFIHTDDKELPGLEPLIAQDQKIKKVKVLLQESGSKQKVQIDVPGACVPKDLEDSEDTRELGVALYSIRLVRER